MLEIREPSQTINTLQTPSGVGKTFGALSISANARRISEIPYKKYAVRESQFFERNKR